MTRNKEALSVKEFYTVKDLAEAWGVSIDFIRSLINRRHNNLPSTLIGRKHIIQYKDIIEFLNREKWVK